MHKDGLHAEAACDGAGVLAPGTTKAGQHVLSRVVALTLGGGGERDQRGVPDQRGEPDQRGKLDQLLGPDVFLDAKVEGAEDYYS